MDKHLNALWLTESIRLTELQSGPLDDRAANQKAKTIQGSIEQKIMMRALHLAQRDGLYEAQKQWIQSSKLAGFLLALLALAGGISLAFSALGDANQPVNVFWALVNLLGLHILSLFFWLSSLLFSSQNITSPLGRCWLWLTQKLARQGRAGQLVPALMILLNRQQALRWAIGCLLHAIWLLILGSTLLTLLTLLSTKHYLFLWQTTLLNSDAVTNIIQALSALPALLGVPQPDLLTINNSANHVLDSDGARFIWASWLIGLFIFYGLLPRVVLFVLCLLCWLRAKKRLAIDLSLSENQRLIERLSPSSEPIGVVDAEQFTATLQEKRQSHYSSAERILAALELDDTLLWPPQLNATTHYLGTLDDHVQRHQAITTLATSPVNRLLIACDPWRSPDRGQLRLIAELAEYASETRVWLLNEKPASPTQQHNWQAAIAKIGITEGDLHWLESLDE